MKNHVTSTAVRANHHLEIIQCQAKTPVGKLDTNVRAARSYLKVNKSWTTISAQQVRKICNSLSVEIPRALYRYVVDAHIRGQYFK